MEIINHCPTCGSPIYAKRYLEEGESPIVQRTCSCYSGTFALMKQDLSRRVDQKSGMEQKDIRDTMHMK